MSGRSLKGLRPIHGPGSVSYSEARNLYFEESYSPQTLLRLGERVLRSICIGEYVGVYFADQNVLRRLQRELLISFGEIHVVGNNLKRLYVHELEYDKPYVVLMKFLLWLYGRYEDRAREGEEGKELGRTLALLRETEGVMYFAPREKAKESTIPLPRLDFFFSMWLDVESRRKALVNMVRNLYDFMHIVIRIASRQGERAAVQKKLDLLTEYYDSFCAQLIRTGSVDFGYLRQITDVLIELSNRYNVSASLSFVRELVSL